MVTSMVSVRPDEPSGMPESVTVTVIMCVPSAAVLAPVKVITPVSGAMLRTPAAMSVEEYSNVRVPLPLST